MYVKHCKLTRYEQSELMKSFVACAPACMAAGLPGVQRNWAVRFFDKLHSAIATIQQKRAAQFCGELEGDDSYFGGKRTGKGRRGMAGKAILSGLPKRDGKLYSVPLANVRRKTLMPVIRQQSIKPDSVVCTNGHTACNALFEVIFGA